MLRDSSYIKFVLAVSKVQGDVRYRSIQHESKLAPATIKKCMDKYREEEMKAINTIPPALTINERIITLSEMFEKVMSECCDVASKVSIAEATQVALAKELAEAIRENKILQQKYLDLQTKFMAQEYELNHQKQVLEETIKQNQEQYLRSEELQQELSSLRIINNGVAK